MLSIRGLDALSEPKVEPGAFTLRLFPPGLELPLQVRSGTRSPCEVLQKPRATVLEMPCSRGSGIL